MTLLAGRYQLLHPLSRGGMGQVWEGEDLRLQRRVAVKLLTDLALSGRGDADDLVRRFTRETSVTAGLRHPGVPCVYDAGAYEGGLFLVLELVGGRTLSDLVAEQGALPVPWAAAIAAQIAATLVTAHETGLVHRDVKPQNVMLTEDGTVKVLDFGLAALLDTTGLSQITRSGEALGTPAYMAPEQLHGSPATPRTDLYALGCVLYELLAGGRLFDGATPAALMFQHLEEAPRPLHRPDLPPALESLVKQLLEKDPGRRPPDARDVCHRLLPHVTASGPLDDVDPTGHLYARALVQLEGPLAGESAASWASPHHAAAWSEPGHQAPSGSWTGPGSVPLPPYPSPVENQSTGWRLRHSLWVLPTLFFGLTTWLSFGYLAVRHQRLWWLAPAAVYFALAVVTFLRMANSPDTGDDFTTDDVITISLWTLAWPVGFVHAIWVNFTVHHRLLARPGR
jgi:serine/threonine protein kinase